MGPYLSSIQALNIFLAKALATTKTHRRAAFVAG